MNFTKQSLKNKGATIDMKCDNAESFKWAVTRSLNPLIKNSERVTKTLRKQSEKYNWDGILFPTTIEQIETFEKNNDLLVNVFGFDEEKASICTLKMFRGSHVGRVPLMFLDDRYLIVKSISRLFCGQNTKRRCKRFYCNSCLKSFPSKGKLDRHIILGCDPEQTGDPKAECDLCVKQGASECPLHLNLNEISGDRLKYIKEIKVDILDPKRVQGLFFSCEGDIYKPTLKEGEWVYTYLGKNENVRIIGLDEDGNNIGVEHACQNCAVGKSSDCGCSTRGGGYDLMEELFESSIQDSMSQDFLRRLRELWESRVISTSN